MNCTRLLAAVTFALVACNAPPAPEPLPGAASSVEAPLAREVTLTFHPDYSVTASGALEQGGSVRVAYASERLPGCRGQLNDGRPAWSITGYYQVDGGEVGSFEAGGLSPSGGSQPPVFELPGSARDVAIWFEVTNRWGCQAFDSSYGANYHFAVSEG